MNAIAFVLELLEAVLLHEFEHALDFRQIHAARLARTGILALFSWPLEFEQFPGARWSNPPPRLPVTTTSSSIRMPPRPST